jgi:ABC-type multidrug transport system fused ATPase/permease subunit
VPHKKLLSNPYFSLLAVSWKNSLPAYKRRYLLVYFLYFITYILGALFPLMYGWFISAIQHDTVSAFSNAWKYGAAYIGLTILIWMFHGPARIMERKLAFDISATFLENLVNSLVHHPLDWHKNHHSGSLINRLKKSYAGLRGFFDNGFIYFQTLIQLILSMSAMIFFSPLFGTISALLGIFSIWINLKFDKPFIRSLDKVNEQEHEVSAFLSDSLGNILTVIALRLESMIKSQLRSKIKLIYPGFRFNAIIGECKWFSANILIALIYAVTVIGYLYTNVKPGAPFPLGGMVALIGFVTQFTVAFNSFVLQYSNVVQFYSDVNAANMIGSDYNGNKGTDPGIGLPATWDVIEIKNLSFSYRDQQPAPLNEMDVSHLPENKTVLDSANLTLQRGKNIALLGHSGAGKSTILSLLRGLYAPDPDVFLILDGETKVDWAAIAEETTLFPQNPEIFENTILFNLTMGLDFEEQEIAQACRTACIDELIAGLPDGRNTLMQEKGLNISGGQKQRLALARGLLASKNSSILLLDEPTSSVDKSTEFDIYRNIIAFAKDKIVISTTHNPDLLEFFDQCLMVKGGIVFEIDRSLNPVILQ